MTADAVERLRQQAQNEATCIALNRMLTAEKAYTAELKEEIAKLRRLLTRTALGIPAPNTLEDCTPMDGQRVLLERAGKFAHKGRVILAIWRGGTWSYAATGDPIKSHPKDLWIPWPSTLKVSEDK